MPEILYDCSSVKLLTWAESGESVSLELSWPLGFTGASNFTIKYPNSPVVDVHLLVLQMNCYARGETLLGLVITMSALGFLHASTTEISHHRLSLGQIMLCYFHWGQREFLCRSTPDLSLRGNLCP